LVALLYAAAGLYVLVRDEFWRPKHADTWAIFNMIPHLSLAWWLVGALAIVCLWLFEASFRVQRKGREKIAALELKTETPDLVIEWHTSPEAFSTLPAQEGTEPSGREGIYIFMRDIRFLNRSTRPLSVEARLNIYLGDDISSGPYLSPDQEDIPFPGMEKVRETRDASIGPHLGRIIHVPPQTVVHGYLTYFFSKAAVQFFVEPISASRNQRILYFLSAAQKALAVIEHISGSSRIVPLDPAGSFRFRDHPSSV